MSQSIPLTQGYSALVSDSDYPTLSQYKWRYVNGYAARTASPNGLEYLHRALLQPAFRATTQSRAARMHQPAILALEDARTVEVPSSLRIPRTASIQSGRPWRQTDGIVYSVVEGRGRDAGRGGL